MRVSPWSNEVVSLSRVSDLFRLRVINPAGAPRRPDQCPGQARGNLAEAYRLHNGWPPPRGVRCRPQLGSLWGRRCSGSLPQWRFGYSWGEGGAVGSYLRRCGRRRTCAARAASPGRCVSLLHHWLRLWLRLQSADTCHGCRHSVARWSAVHHGPRRSTQR